MIDPLDTALSKVGVDACCIHTVRTVLHLGDPVDDGDTIACQDCPTVLELHGRVWVNPLFVRISARLA